MPVYYYSLGANESNITSIDTNLAHIICHNVSFLLDSSIIAHALQVRVLAIRYRNFVLSRLCIVSLWLELSVEPTQRD
jgi:hypothetical protein